MGSEGLINDYLEWCWVRDNDCVCDLERDRMYVCLVYGSGVFRGIATVSMYLSFLSIFAPSISNQIDLPLFEVERYRKSEQYVELQVRAYRQTYLISNMRIWEINAEDFNGKVKRNKEEV